MPNRAAGSNPAGKALMLVADPVGLRRDRVLERQRLAHLVALETQVEVMHFLAQRRNTLRMLRQNAANSCLTSSHQ
jgi:hypothetical protein